MSIFAPEIGITGITDLRMTLRDLKRGEVGRVIRVGGEGALRQHLIDMGVLPDTVVKIVKYAPMGDPIEILIHGYELTLRMADAASIEIERIDRQTHRNAERTARRNAADSEWEVAETPHPGLGEPHISAEEIRQENPLPKGTVMTFALAGNQNCGKTTLFNNLTGSAQHVGNFPGVTVDRKSGQIIGHPDTLVVDLPGIYSLSPYTSEEIVSRNFIIREHPHCIINILDATNIERNLYLSMQLIELGVPMVLALNMMDELEGNGGAVRINEMEALLGVPVVAISAARNQGIQELIDHALHIAYFREEPKRQDFCSPDDHGGAVHRCLHAIMHLIEDHAERAGLPIRFAASKLVEGDSLVLEALQLEPNEYETVQHIIRQMEDERGLDATAALADMRFTFIQRLCQRTVVKPQLSREHLRSLAFDKILTGRFTAWPAFILIMGLIFWLTFESLGVWLQDMLAAGIDDFTGWVDVLLTDWAINPAVHSLVIDGVFSGVGSVLSFVPLILLLFFFLSMLEDSGYMARIAFVTDHLLRRIGLSGRSIVPMLIGFGCSVPSVMASRTMPSERDRRLTIMLTPFMSCSAKVAIYAFIAEPFFGHNAWVVMVGLYLLGILTGVVVAVVAKTFVLKGEAAPFVMELPNYRMPGFRNVFHLLRDKTKDFVERAFTVIFLATIVIWFLQHFSFRLQMVDPSSNDSILAVVSGLIAPVFSPLGFGDWRLVTALVSGFMAKESVVATIETLSAGTPVTSLMTTGGAVCYLVFCLLYTPCVAAIAAIRRELGNRYALFVLLLQCGVAWLVAFVVSFFVPML
jgi:ferrous iron transport protein B